MLPGREKQRHLGSPDAQREDAHLPLILQHDCHLRLLRNPLGVNAGRSQDKEKDAALAQAALDGRDPFFAGQDAVRGHPDVEAALAQVGGQADSEVGVGVGIADKELVGIAGGRCRFGRQVKIGLEKVTVRFRAQPLHDDDQVVEAVMAVGEVNQGADFLAERHALTQGAAGIGKVVKDQIGQLIVVKRLNHELAQPRPINHVNLPQRSDYKVIRRLGTI